MLTIFCVHMQVNYVVKLKLSADRPALDEQLNEILDRRPDLTAEILDGPGGALGLPLWTSVFFSAQHGFYRGLVDAVHYELERSGIDERFTPAHAD